MHRPHAHKTLASIVVAAAAGLGLAASSASTLVVVAGALVAGLIVRAALALRGDRYPDRYRYAMAPPVEDLLLGSAGDSDEEDEEDLATIRREQQIDALRAEIEGLEERLRKRDEDERRSALLLEEIARFTAPSLAGLRDRWCAFLERAKEVDRRGDAGEITRTIERVSGTLEELLALAKVRGGSYDAAAEPTPVATAVREAVGEDVAVEVEEGAPVLIRARRALIAVTVSAMARYLRGCIGEAWQVRVRGELVRGDLVRVRIDLGTARELPAEDLAWLRAEPSARPALHADRFALEVASRAAQKLGAKLEALEQPGQRGLSLELVATEIEDRRSASRRTPAARTAEAGTV